MLRLLIYKPGMFLDMPGLLHLYGMYGRCYFAVIALNKMFFLLFTQVKIFITQLFCRIYFFIFIPVGPSDFIKPAPAGRWA
ncbi:MAG: hypothetical protein BCS36_11415 [Desulfovibrio sp. MES5]|nr:MAG: hypothetical protein BCS36_11415 [Desulfovibrio sp. MES5]